MKSSKSPRARALSVLRDLVTNEKIFDWDQDTGLPEKDHALFHQLVLGTLRHWRYLEKCISEHCGKKPKRQILDVLLLSAYQLVFLDRVPEYAVFSEAKNLCQDFSSREAEFVHAVLKKIDAKKKDYRTTHDALLEPLAHFAGGRPLTDAELAALNVSSEFLDVLKTGPQATYAKTVVAARVMKREQSTAGWAFPWNKKAAAGEMGYHIQGEASQAACRAVAEEILKRAVPGKPLRFLEATAGKGGKFLGTLRYLLQAKELPRIDWFAADRSTQQLAFLSAELTAIQNEQPDILERVRVTLEPGNWKAEAPAEWNETFDIIWLDAPCTAFGTIGKYPEIALTRGAEPKKAVESLAAAQKNILQKTLPLLKKGGLFVYSVCTLTGAETVRQAEFIERALRGERGLNGERREFVFWPGQAPLPDAEGFYFVLIQ